MSFYVGRSDVMLRTAFIGLTGTLLGGIKLKANDWVYPMPSPCTQASVGA